MKSKVQWKTILIAEIIISYMALLTVVSHICAPQAYRAETEAPILMTSDFVSFSGESAERELLFRNDTSGSAVGYQSALKLTEAERIAVTLKINCPEEYSGCKLYVDLYESESGYDDPEQEAVLTTEAGEQEAELILYAGEQHPENAWLRIFTTDKSEFSVEKIVVSEAVPQEKVSKAMLGVTALIVFGTMGTALYCISKWRKEGEGEYESRNDC